MREVTKDTVRRIAAELWGKDLDGLCVNEADLDQLVAEVRAWQEAFRTLGAHDPMGAEPSGDPAPADG
jgi:hypothetical protein